MDGPYRDLGSGFARLSGSEAPRRAPSSISRVEDVLLELLRNARDAGASSIYVATSLRARRYRSLTVIDDGAGVPEGYEESIFAPGVTSRHLTPISDGNGGATTLHGAGLALAHIRDCAVEARLLRRANPTSFGVVLDTRVLPERSLQSTTNGRPSGRRTSRSNLASTSRAFAHANPKLNVYHSSPSTILATLLENHIIRSRGDGKGIRDFGVGLGLEVSGRTVSRVIGGEVETAVALAGESGPYEGERGEGAGKRREATGTRLVVGEREREEISSILRRVARASYLDIGDLSFESRPGEFHLRARVHEPEDEYE